MVNNIYLYKNLALVFLFAVFARTFGLILYCWVLQAVFSLLGECETYSFPRFVNSHLSRRSQPLNCSEPARVAVFTPSTPDDFELRAAIRRTWARPFIEDPNFHFFFAVALSTTYVDATVSIEVERYGDILHLDHHDAYYNMSLKIMNTLRYIRHVCPHIEHVLRVDSDMVAHHHNLKRFLQIEMPSDNTPAVYGYCRRYDCVTRIPSSKGCMSKLNYANSFYPSYCFGFGYLLSKDVVTMALQNCELFSGYFALDDILLTALLAPAAVKVHHGLLFDHQLGLKSLGCNHLAIVSKGGDNTVSLLNGWNVHRARCSYMQKRKNT